ncbi:flavin monoamine oxidase family protein [Ancylobacter mangrovi]|uniref:flavin monoamine oxidase family protein n=1 Tax=Ancylobacter mangrovi TaxID=2972472 RepID=UPI0021614F52|nr:FAD-dependent oxidoreductase [Ancylobacter mangrovi]MCS0502673.1 FAD-dependent oxidoreductase [Ancylobacter mangrovi]
MSERAIRAARALPGPLSRRRFLAGASAALLAGPALAQSGATDVDVAIVGGGAAGIAAARRIAGSGHSYVLLEAGPRLGGRARTVEALGMEVDLGCGLLPGDFHPLLAAADAAGLAVTDLSNGPRLYVEGREAKESDYDHFLAALGQARRDIRAAADAGKDVAVATVMPKPEPGSRSGPWEATAADMLGPLGCGRGLETLSTLDLALRAPPAGNATSPVGVGAMLQTLGAWLNLQTDAPVTQITHGGRVHALRVEGQRGLIRARAIILAVPAPVIAAGAIKFNPALPRRLAQAFDDCPAGALEQVAFLLPGNPLRLEADERILPRAGKVPALLRGRVNGTDLHILTFGDAPAREIAAKGKEAGLRLARAFLGEAFALAPETVTEVACSAWTTDPLIRGAMAAVRPGKGAQRRLFEDPVQTRIFLAGEYTSTDSWGSLAGAWESGEVAAAKALALLGDGPS